MKMDLLDYSNKRGGRLVSTYDFYDLIVRGSTKTEVALQRRCYLYSIY